MHHPGTRVQILTALAAAMLLTSTFGFARAADSTTAAPADAAPAPHAGDHYQGQVTSIDAAAKTFVIETRVSQTSMTIKTDATTKIQATRNIGVAGLKVGDHVIALGQVNPDQTTVTARQIRLLGDDIPVKFKISPRAAGGTVATVTPALTLTGKGGKTITVVADERTRVLAPRDADFSDLAVGNQVDVRGALDGTTFTATSVTVTTMRGRRRKLDAAPPTDAPPPAMPAALPTKPDSETDPLDTP